MINVAFLLLIFFLMAAVIAPPDPLEVTLPESEAERADSDTTVIIVSAAGVMARGDLRGEAIFEGLADKTVQLRVDADVPGADLARLLGRLSAAGVEQVELVTRQP